MKPEDVTDEMLDAAQAVADQASLFGDPWAAKRAVLAAAINAMPQSAAQAQIDAARRISELETELAEARKEAARLKARSIAYEDAYRVAYLATYQSHNGHWDATMQGGRGCPECIRAREARENCDAILREGLEHLVTIAGSAK